MNVCLFRRTGLVISHVKKLYYTLYVGLISKREKYTLHIGIKKQRRNVSVIAIKCSEAWFQCHRKVMWVYITEGANEHWNANYTKVSLWWWMAFQFRILSNVVRSWVFDIISVFSLPINWRKLRYDRMSNRKVIHIFLAVFSTWTYYDILVQKQRG